MSLRRVVKVGGSLLDLPDLSNRLHEWLSRQLPMDSFLVIGGGQLVESVRDLDRIHQLEEEFAHWFCVDLLNRTSCLMQSIVPDLKMVKAPQQLEAILHEESEEGATPQLFLVQPGVFYSRDNDYPELPASWATTTDSIAAVLAKRIEATELVLLKSTLPECKVETHEGWAELQFVDGSFPLAAGGLHCRFVNLRSSEFDEK